jgi:hypothetical protein
MKIKKNTFSTLVLELRFTTIANCKKLKIQKIQKSTSPKRQCASISVCQCVLVPEPVCQCACAPVCQCVSVPAHQCAGICACVSGCHCVIASVCFILCKYVLGQVASGMIYMYCRSRLIWDSDNFFVGAPSGGKKYKHGCTEVVFIHANWILLHFTI